MSETEEFIIVDELKPGLRGINIKVRCNSKNEEREVISRKTGETFKVTEALVGDETASILLTLWNDDIDKVEIDKNLKLINVYTTVFKGSLRLNIGKYGSFEEISDEELNEVNTENNLSNREYEQPRKFRREYGGGGGRFSQGRGGQFKRRPYRGDKRSSYGRKKY
ncbi:MAG: single-stranded DNA-binding protein [Candidatus Helarchaeota archaeon]|nr:single-stranded DNA-binding protein [Candidatus Helarchaeota archaeon]